MSAAQLGFADLGRACRNDLADLCVGFLGQPQAQPFCLCTAFVNPHDICFYTIDACHNDERDRFLQHCPAEFATVRELARPPAGVSDEEFAAMLPPLPANYAPSRTNRERSPPCSTSAPSAAMPGTTGPTTSGGCTAGSTTA